MHWTMANDALCCTIGHCSVPHGVCVAAMQFELTAESTRPSRPVPPATDLVEQQQRKHESLQGQRGQVGLPGGVKTRWARMANVAQTRCFDWTQSEGAVSYRMEHCVRTLPGKVVAHGLHVAV